MIRNYASVLMLTGSQVTGRGRSDGQINYISGRLEWQRGILVSATSWLGMPPNIPWSSSLARARVLDLRPSKSPFCFLHHTQISDLSINKPSKTTTMHFSNLLTTLTPLLLAISTSASPLSSTTLIPRESGP